MCTPNIFGPNPIENTGVSTPKILHIIKWPSSWMVMRIVIPRRLIRVEIKRFFEFILSPLIFLI